jgi:hypothetical protein
MTHANFIRQHLPDRRTSEIFALQAGGLNFTATASRFDDGALFEILIQNHKADIAASLTLRPLELLRKALKRGGQGRAIGPLAAENRSDAA